MMSLNEKSHLSVANSSTENDGNQSQVQPEKTTNELSEFESNMNLPKTDKQISATRSAKIEKPKQSKASTFFTPIHEMLKKTEPLDWLVDSYLETQTLNLLFGDPASCKSFITVDIACCIASGVDWHGHKVKAGRVFYIAGEGNRGYSARCAAWSVQNGICLDDAQLSFSKKTINLSDSYAVTNLNVEIAEMTDQAGEPPRLIIVDTLARSTEADENSSREMTNFIKQLDEIKDQHHCSILLVHHTGHGDKNRARGSTVLKGALDAEYRVSKGNDGIVRLECTKMKESEAAKAMAFKLTDVLLPNIDDQGKPIYKAALECIEYTGSVKMSSAGLGKNQKLGLSVLNAIMNDIKASLGNDSNSDVGTIERYIPISDWKDKLEAMGINRQRFYEIKKGLIDAGLIAIDEDDQNFVRLCNMEFDSQMPI